MYIPSRTAQVLVPESLLQGGISVLIDTESKWPVDLTSLCLELEEDCKNANKEEAQRNGVKCVFMVKARPRAKPKLRPKPKGAAMLMNGDSDVQPRARNSRYPQVDDYSPQADSQFSQQQSSAASQYNPYQSSQYPQYPSANENSQYPGYPSANGYSQDNQYSPYNTSSAASQYPQYSSANGYSPDNQYPPYGSPPAASPYGYSQDSQYSSNRGYSQDGDSQYSSNRGYSQDSQYSPYQSTPASQYAPPNPYNQDFQHQPFQSSSASHYPQYQSEYGPIVELTPDLDPLVQPALNRPLRLLPSVGTWLLPKKVRNGEALHGCATFDADAKVTPGKKAKKEKKEKKVKKDKMEKQHRKVTSPDNKQPKLVDPRKTLASLDKLPVSIKEWQAVQDRVFQGHPAIPEGWVRVWSKSKDREYYVRVHDMHQTFDFSEVK
eukprot:gnl/MRDRNA2_/MRDRNA2_125998_c0_seq1.p1 gnl/MRDRNA2_/MRDRNA2_125998_c0~~gnl/MRDRNA2_/MRDRNA2_125998_c0_seq1.p1  ORF type:complete len:442 (+),score=49.23 gnl/MRDRNA2_/MRDRNA2_125998_c0_seq1:22-1326(+)